MAQNSYSKRPFRSKSLLATLFLFSFLVCFVLFSSWNRFFKPPREQKNIGQINGLIPSITPQTKEKNGFDDEETKRELESHAQLFLNKLKQNKELAAYQMTNEGFRKATPYSRFLELIQSLPQQSKENKLELFTFLPAANKGFVSALYQDLEEPIAFDMHFDKQEEGWLLSQLKVLLSKTSQEQKDEKQKLQETAERLIAQIQDGEYVRAYYQGTTKGFKRNAPLDAFSDFIKTAPALEKGRTTHLETNITPPLGFVSLCLDEGCQLLPLKLTFLNEPKGWKLHALEVGSSDEIAQLTVQNRRASNGIRQEPIQQSENNLNPTNDQDRQLLSAVQEFLTAIQLGDLQRVWQDMTSQKFKNANTIDAFRLLISSYPLIRAASATLNHPYIEGSIAAVDAVYNDGKKRVDLHLLLTKEEGEWKLLGMDVEQRSYQEPQLVVEQKQTPKQTPIAPSVVNKEKEAPAKQETISQPKEQPVTVEAPGNILTPVERLIDNLRHSDASAAYDYYMSNAFKKATPYPEFAKVMKELPAITQGIPSFSNPRLEENWGTVIANLSSPFGKTSFNFSLILEEGRWKIHSIYMENTTPPQTKSAGTPMRHPPKHLSPETLDPTSVEYPIRAMLFMIANNELTSSYYRLMSEKFKLSTTIDEYENFINGYAIFTHNEDLGIQESQVEGDETILRVFMSSDSGESGTVEFELVKERGVWRVQNMQVINYTAPPKGISDKKSKNEETAKTTPLFAAPLPTQKSAVDPSKQKEISEDPVFFRGSFGTEVDQMGLISDPKSTIDSKAGNIYFNLHLEKGKVGQKINLEFEHVPSGNKISDIQSELSHPGAGTLSYIFAPPSGGWPKGVYRLQVKAEGGSSEQYLFRIN